MDEKFCLFCDKNIEHNRYNGGNFSEILLVNDFISHNICHNFDSLCERLEKVYIDVLRSNNMNKKDFLLFKNSFP